MEWEIRNRYGIPVKKGEGVFNGDIGIVRDINVFAETLEVEFDEGRRAEYSFKQLEELELAYAVTVHKSQGSEYSAVVLPIFSGYDKLYFRNLLYTAVTRARKLLIIVGSESRVYQMVDNNRKMLRYTGLRWFLQQEAGKQNTPNDEADG